MNFLCQVLIVSVQQEQRSLTEKSMIAFDQTDDANSKMAAVSERESKNNAQNMNELRELLRHIDHDTSVKDFLVTKSQDRSAQAEALAQSRRAATQNKFEAAAEKTLNEYQNAIKEVKELTGANSFEGIVDHYLKMEEANYAKFNCKFRIFKKYQNDIIFFSHQRNDKPASRDAG